MKTDTTTFCLGAILSIAILAIVGGVANGWALATVWNWFIPPIFGLTTLTLFKAIGVATVFQLFTGAKNASDSNKSSKDKTLGEIFFESLIVALITPALTVAFAWVILQFAF